MTICQNNGQDMIYYVPKIIVTGFPAGSGFCGSYVVDVSRTTPRKKTSSVCNKIRLTKLARISSSDRRVTNVKKKRVGTDT